MGYLEDHAGQRFAETMLYWRGEMRASDVEKYLGVSERTARTLISRWRNCGDILPRFRPGHMRCLIPVDGFSPPEEVQDPAITLTLLLAAEHFPANPFSSSPPIAGGHDLSLSAKIHTNALRSLIKACLERKAITLIYLSKRHKEEMVFSPSALVRSRGRYHFRGYRSNAQDLFANPLEDRYVDIVPGRALEAWFDPESQFIDLANDKDWYEFEEQYFFLSEKLTEEETLCYEHEYGISETGFLKIQQRRALIPYIRQELLERLCWRQDGTFTRIWSQALPNPT